MGSGQGVPYQILLADSRFMRKGMATNTLIYPAYVE